jgi:acetoin utilization deacetylase AcuC-like enzyme
VYHEVLGPLVNRFLPEMIFIDAGFDGHHEDLIGRSKFTEKVFGWLTRLCLKLRAEIGAPPILFALEGGYAPRAVASSVKEVLKALVEAGHGAEFPKAQSGQAVEIVEKAKRIHAKYGVWTD